MSPAGVCMTSRCSGARLAWGAAVLGAFLVWGASASAEQPSCGGTNGAALDCGGDSCCTRLAVAGGDFDFVGDDGARARARVGSFDLDKYEVTVGRLRAWVRAGQPLPADGETIVGDGASAMRWQPSWRVVPEGELAGWARYGTWTAGDERLPVNQIDWFTAAAFCHFDGGRLPTDTEWQYAAVGGDEQRPHPWGSEAPTPDRAVYNCMGDGNPDCALGDILPVGSRPLGAGRWGHMDLAGSLFEWTVDGGAAKDASATPQLAHSRGSGFCYIGGVDRRTTTLLRPTVSRLDSVTTRSHMVGVRCAYDRGGPRP